MSRSGAVASSSGLRQRDASRGTGLRIASAGPACAGRRARLATVAKLTKDGPHLCIVGTTGAVGQEFLSVRSACQHQGSPPAWLTNLRRR